jgi:hypothetical protein
MPDSRPLTTKNPILEWVVEMADTWFRHLSVICSFSTFDNVSSLFAFFTIGRLSLIFVKKYYD